MEIKRKPKHQDTQGYCRNENIIIDGHYIVQTPKGLKKVKVVKSNKKNVRDEIKIEKL